MPKLRQVFVPGWAPCSPGRLRNLPFGASRGVRLARRSARGTTEARSRRRRRRAAGARAGAASASPSSAQARRGTESNLDPPEHGRIMTKASLTWERAIKSPMKSERMCRARRSPSPRTACRSNRDRLTDSSCRRSQWCLPGSTRAARWRSRAGSSGSMAPPTEAWRLASARRPRRACSTWGRASSRCSKPGPRTTGLPAAGHGLRAARPLAPLAHSRIRPACSTSRRRTAYSRRRSGSPGRAHSRSSHTSSSWVSTSSGTCSSRRPRTSSCSTSHRRGTGSGSGSRCTASSASCHSGSSSGRCRRRARCCCASRYGNRSRRAPCSLRGSSSLLPVDVGSGDPAGLRSLDRRAERAARGAGVEATPRVGARDGRSRPHRRDACRHDGAAEQS